MLFCGSDKLLAQQQFFFITFTTFLGGIFASSFHQTFSLVKSFYQIISFLRRKLQNTWIVSGNYII